MWIMSKILIGYASHYGQTRKIAARIAATLEDRDHDVTMFDLAGPRQESPDGYDVVVLGSRVETGRHAPAFRAYVQAHRAKLAQRSTAMFSVSMAAAHPHAGTDPEGYIAKTCQELGWSPMRCASFAGGLPYRKYGWVTRLVMKTITKRAGGPTDTSRDHELTHWDEVDTFAREIDALRVSEIITPVSTFVRPA